MEKMHSLLARQLKKYFGESPPDSPADRLFIDAVNRAYIEFDSDRRMLERSMDLSSKELLHANEILKASDERYRLIFNEMLDGFGLHEIILDEGGRPSDYRFLEVNPAFERITGLSAGAVIGRTAKEVMPDIEPYWIDAYGKVATNGIGARFESYASSLDKWFEVVAFPAGGKGRFAAIFADVTERKRAEAKMRASEEKFRGMFESMRDGIALADLRGRILDVNTALLNMLGYTRSELIGMHAKDITSDAWYDATDAALGRAIKDGDSGEYEKEYVGKNGNVFPVRVRIWLMHDENGSPSGLWALIRDISDQKSSEGEIRKRMSEIEKLNRFMIGREERIIEVKKEVNELLKKTGQPPKYKV